MRLIAISAALACTLPAASGAAPTWERTPDPAPGGTLEYYDGNPIVDMAVVAGTPYVAKESLGGELSVWRPTEDGTDWYQVGPALNHVPLRFEPPFRRGDFFSISSSSATPWVAWTEQASGGATQVHVARLSGGGFREPAAAGGWPSASSSIGVQIVVVAGRPYVSTDTGEVARLAAGGQVERVTAGLPSGCLPRLTVVAAKLYASCSQELLRLNGGGSAWQHVVTQAAPFVLVDVSGTPYLIGGGAYRLGSNGQVEKVANDDSNGSVFAGYQGTPYAAASGDTPGPDVLGPVTLEGLVAGSWFSAPSPSLPNEGGTAVKLVEDSDGNMWLLWHASENNYVATPRYVHVARFAEQGTPFVYPPDPNSAPADGEGEDPGVEPDPIPDDPYTDPNGDPVPDDYVDPPGPCSNVLLGKLGSDRLVGTSGSDRIVGRAGNDSLFGRGGGDCIWGGLGNDRISGGAGADQIHGDRGNDRISAGSGSDDVAAGRGNDVIDARRGGADRIDCGAGHDTVRLSSNDLMRRCERVLVGR